MLLRRVVSRQRHLQFRNAERTHRLQEAFAQWLEAFHGCGGRWRVALRGLRVERTGRLPKRRNSRQIIVWLVERYQRERAMSLWCWLRRPHPSRSMHQSMSRAVGSHFGLKAPAMSSSKKSGKSATVNRHRHRHRSWAPCLHRNKGCARLGRTVIRGLSVEKLGRCRPLQTDCGVG
jgi:hypothetical protein